MHVKFGHRQIELIATPAARISWTYQGQPVIVLGRIRIANFTIKIVGQISGQRTVIHTHTHTHTLAQTDSYMYWRRFWFNKPLGTTSISIDGAVNWRGTSRLSPEHSEFNQ